jgi:hypothetical protein
MLDLSFQRILPLYLLLVVSAFAGTARAQLQFGPATTLSLGMGDAACPSLSSDGLTLYFQGQLVNSSDYDIWTATRSNRFGSFDPAVSLAPPVNSPTTLDYQPSISFDGLSLFLTSRRSGGLGIADNYVATRAHTNENFGTPVNLGDAVNSSSLDSGPDISADGLILFFQSDRPGSFGQFLDTYTAKRSSPSASFEAATNLGPSINQGDGAANPSISADGLSLFFASGDQANQPSFGGTDLWVRTRASLNDSWGDPVNLGPNVNSPFDDDFPDVAWDGKSITFASNRNGGGLYQIYEAAVVPEPSALALAACGLLLVGLAARRCLRIA